MDDLEFRNIPGYSGVYQITRQGVVRSNGRDCRIRNVRRRDGSVRDIEIWHRKTKILKPISTFSKPLVHLHNVYGERKNFYVAQLVAMCYLTDGELVPIRKIGYKDGDVYNVSADNLIINRYSTQEE